ncbi:MAG: OmpA family protein [Saprospiraceae bacterium]|nr:OmpA family protein [Saprospiraceae bacterium]
MKKIPKKSPASVSEPVAISEPVILKNVFFDTASSELRPESFSELEKLKNFLNENPGLVIRIQGHTDNVGEDLYNKDLSLARAKAVYQFLIDKGISLQRLSFEGFGEIQPIDSNDTEQGRQNNRRTEFVVLSSKPE